MGCLDNRCFITKSILQIISFQNTPGSLQIYRNSNYQKKTTKKQNPIFKEIKLDEPKRQFGHFQSARLGCWDIQVSISPDVGQMFPAAACVGSSKKESKCWPWWTTCPPLHLHPERNWSAEQGWQTRLRSAPAVLLVASAATPAEQSLPVAAVPAHKNQFHCCKHHNHMF